MNLLVVTNEDHKSFEVVGSHGILSALRLSLWLFPYHQCFLFVVCYNLYVNSVISHSKPQLWLQN